MSASNQSQRDKKTPEARGLPFRNLRILEQRLNVFLVAPQDGLQVNPTNVQRFSVLNMDQNETLLGTITSQGRWFSEEELTARVRDLLPRNNRR
ncbi:MAG: hypothetical protein A2534_04310 [Candidatus Magasanikbacteria bacterium RIFOXYD2_FULL_39_9]|uniref:Uncharacterized protein n=1 Tax=Candidatus Magasanikbacteria bacterium RIFOXYD1_FULL_40_23 TaxID=1798705 RepID=A0A1F6PB75_9BACT|nr:MAG: hypothetical protein A2534_04310 [Candidatus Magasanikbacteria bacterium RIFOXYD2_FULL_39_9]OGH93411.1 MAG: hypothetical protein A2563_02270 [Candidatus Magasanikbacteria bacterium RIFOXYD1_FULL_40_23]